jgi:hypothetical protein
MALVALGRDEVALIVHRQDRLKIELPLDTDHRLGGEIADPAFENQAAYSLSRRVPIWLCAQRAASSG